MAAKAKKTTRNIVHNSKYNRVQILIRDPRFQSVIKKLEKSFADLGCPLPEGKFKTEKEFETWKNKYFKLRIKKAQKVGFYEEVFRNILIDNDIEPEDKFYRNFLKSYVFFDYQEPETPPLKIKVTFNKKTKQEELHIQIFPHTTQNDIKKAWKIIEKEKRIIFKNEEIKSKKWQRKNIDIEAYNLSVKWGTIPLKERKKEFHEAAIDAIIRNELKEKYGNISFDSIRRSINKVKTYKKVTDKKRSKS